MTVLPPPHAPPPRIGARMQSLKKLYATNKQPALNKLPTEPPTSLAARGEDMLKHETPDDSRLSEYHTASLEINFRRRGCHAGEGVHARPLVPDAITAEICHYCWGWWRRGCFDECRLLMMRLLFSTRYAYGQYPRTLRLCLTRWADIELDERGHCESRHCLIAILGKYQPRWNGSRWRNISSIIIRPICRYLCDLAVLRRSSHFNERLYFASRLSPATNAHEYVDTGLIMISRRRHASYLLKRHYSSMLSQYITIYYADDRGTAIIGLGLSRLTFAASLSDVCEIDATLPLTHTKFYTPFCRCCHFWATAFNLFISFAEDGI